MYLYNYLGYLNCSTWGIIPNLSDCEYSVIKHNLSSAGKTPFLIPIKILHINILMYFKGKYKQNNPLVFKEGNVIRNKNVR